MATVYAALQKQPRRTVAIKVLRPASRTDAALRRFRREIEILGKLRHRSIAQVYAAGVHEDDDGPLPYFVMEYVPRAKTVIDHADARDLSIEQRLRLFVKICAAVDHGHQSKIIHRDLKPGNILIDETGEPKVIDFGIAHAAELELRSPIGIEESSYVGTIQYMAPEQLEEMPRDLDARCDVWALGILLYRLLTGRPPHDLSGLPVFTAVQLIREEPPPRAGTINPTLKGDLEAIISKALAKDRARRYRTAGSLGRDVLRYLANIPVRGRRSGRLHRLRLAARRRRVEVRAGAIVLLVVLVAAIIVMSRPLSPSGLTVTPDPLPAPTDPPGAPPAAPPTGPVDLRHHTGTVRTVCFDPSGAHVASASMDNEVGLWSLQPPALLSATSEHGSPVDHLAFDGNGTTLVSAANEPRIVLTDTATSRHTSIRTDCDGVGALAVSSDGSVIAVACDDLTVRLLDRAGDSRAILRGTSGAFTALAFNAGGTAVAAGSERGRVSIYDASTGRSILRLQGLRHAIVAVAFDEGATAAIALDTEGKGAMWRLDGDGRLPDARFSTTISGVVDAAFDAAGRRLIIASEHRYQIIDTVEFRADGLPVDVQESIRAIAISSEATHVLIGGDEGALRVIDRR
jgi:serine/threonine protein kinase